MIEFFGYFSLFLLSFSASCSFCICSYTLIRFLLGAFNDN